MSLESGLHLARSRVGSRDLGAAGEEGRRDGAADLGEPHNVERKQKDRDARRDDLHTVAASSASAGRIHPDLCIGVV